MRETRVALVSMPFVDDRVPSIQLGILAEVARRTVADVRTVHAGLELAATMDIEVYRALSQHRGALVGDWLFSVEAFADGAPDPSGARAAELARDIPELGGADVAPSRLRELRTEAIPALLDRLERSAELHDATVVGFSCTFQQTVASIALARRLKARNPDVVIVFGGTSVEGGMGVELGRTVDVIDTIAQGDGEASLPALLEHVAAGEPVPPLITTPSFGDLDESPTPDYTEYFARAERLRLLDDAARVGVRLPFETARGCWWGAKHHCTFCGLNGASMQFRRKSPERVRADLSELTRRHGTFCFDAVDNILDHRYLTDLIPVLADESDYDLFWEVKANLGRDELRALQHAGVRRIQPGIESLSSRLLSLMRKGVRAAQNVNVLRWARYYGIYVDWNLLFGFPGELETDYAAQEAAVPALEHLQPPYGASRIWLERFSPLFTEQTPRVARRPHESYRWVYPADTDLDELAYFFDRDTTDTLPDSAYAALTSTVRHWQQSWDDDARPSLTFRRAPGLIRIDEARPAFDAGIYTFTGPLAALYLQTNDRPVTAAALTTRMAGELSARDIDYALDQFTQRGLMYRDGDFVVALALPASSRR